VGLIDTILVKTPAFQTKSLRILTYLCAVAVGWGLWSALGSRMTAPGAEGEAARSFRSARRSGNSAEGRGAQRILDEAANHPHLKIEPRTKRIVDYRRRLESAEALLEKAKSIAPAEDVGAAALARLKECIANGVLDEETQIRLLHWMQKDPKAAFTWFAARSKEDLATVTPLLRSSMDALIVSQGVESALGWMGSNGTMDKEVVRMIADHGGATGDLQLLERLKGGLEQQRWNDARLWLIDTWPFDKAADLMKLAQKEKAPLTVLLYAKGQGPEGVEWLQKLLEGNTLDPAFRNSLSKHHDYHQLMFKSPQLDFNKRVEVVQSFEPGKPLEQVQYELGVQDVVDAMSSGRDWRYAFRNGTATADEIYQEMAKQLPELASKSPESLKLQLFKELAEAGGPDAIRLLDDIPGEKKWQLAMKAPQWNFEQANPDDFHAFISSIPADEAPTTWDTRLRVWQSKVGNFDSRLGEGFTEWVKNLPEGIDREMASYALLRRKGDADPELAATLKCRIKDPRIQELLNQRQ
jgi:hypothetical protein